MKAISHYGDTLFPAGRGEGSQISAFVVWEALGTWRASKVPLPLTKAHSSGQSRLLRPWRPSFPRSFPRPSKLPQHHPRSDGSSSEPLALSREGGPHARCFASCANMCVLHLLSSSCADSGPSSELVNPYEGRPVGARRCPPS